MLLPAIASALTRTPLAQRVQASWLSRCNSMHVGAPAAQLWPTRPVGEGGPPPQRLTGAPSKSPPNGR
eukprot:191073-Alexandrium_andersonii.AAC.1